jgi:hypothetical protein
VFAAELAVDGDALVQFGDVEIEAFGFAEAALGDPFPSPFSTRAQFASSGLVPQLQT